MKSATKTSYVVHKGKRSKVETTIKVADGEIDGRINDVEVSGSNLVRCDREGNLCQRGSGSYLGRAARCWARPNTATLLRMGPWSSLRSARRSPPHRMAQDLAAHGHSSQAYLVAVRCHCGERQRVAGRPSGRLLQRGPWADLERNDDPSVF